MFSSVYMTTSSQNEAKEIARVLLDKKLIACANIFQINSIYNWENKLQDDFEFAVIMKTQTDLVEQVITEASTLHSYKVPCIVSWSIGSGYKDYLDWIGTVTTK